MITTPEGRAKHSERMRKLWQDPQYRARQAEALSRRERHPASLLPPKDSLEFKAYRKMRDKLGAHAARQKFNIPPPQKARAERPSVIITRRVGPQSGNKGSFSGEAREASPPPINGLTAEMAERRRRFIERHG